MPRRYPWPLRVLQLVTGVHKVHHIMYSFGWKLPLVRVAYFPPWSVNGQRFAYGWRRIGPRDHHDCTATGRY